MGARRRQPPPARVPASRRHGHLFGHVMVPVDLSDRNERALRTALALAREAGSRVTLFHVIQRVPGLAPGELERFYRLLIDRSERRLREVARSFTSKGVEVSTQVRIGEPAAEIVPADSSRTPGKPELGAEVRLLWVELMAAGADPKVTEQIGPTAKHDRT